MPVACWFSSQGSSLHNTWGYGPQDPPDTKWRMPWGCATGPSCPPSPFPFTNAFPPFTEERPTSHPSLNLTVVQSSRAKKTRAPNKGVIQNRALSVEKVDDALIGLQILFNSALSTKLKQDLMELSVGRSLKIIFDDRSLDDFWQIKELSDIALTKLATSTYLCEHVFQFLQLRLKVGKRE